MVDQTAQRASQQNGQAGVNARFIKKHLIFLVALFTVTLAIGVVGHLGELLKEPQSQDQAKQLVGPSLATALHDVLCPYSKQLKNASQLWWQFGAPLVALAWVLLHIEDFKKLTAKKASP